MPNANCPDREQLRAYATGDVFGQAADTLAEHINTCGGCQALLETIDDAEDSLVVRLRRAPQHDKYRNETQCQVALRRAEAAEFFLRPSSIPSSEDTDQSPNLDVLGEIPVIGKTGPRAAWEWSTRPCTPSSAVWLP